MAEEIKCLCGEWHKRTGLTVGGDEVIACPMIPKYMMWGFRVNTPPEVRDGQDA